MARVRSSPALRSCRCLLVAACGSIAAACAGAAVEPDGGGGDDGAGGAGGGASACSATPSPGPTPLRRLTRVEYDNTVRELLGDTSRPSSIFPPDEKLGGFDNNASTLTVSTLHADQYAVAAETLAARAVTNLPKLLPCNPAQAGEDACARSFIAEFGRRAYRRPLSDAEATRLFAVYSYGKGKAAYPFAARVQMVLEAMLQSPNFLYRPEFGAAPGAGETVVALSPYEVASRLSYLIWGSMPDDELFRAAAAGELGSAARLEAQARRMLADGRARAAFARFTELWLELDRIPDLEKETAVFRSWRPELRDAMHAEATRFVEHVVWGGAGDLRTLLSSPDAFVDARLAAVYGIAPPAGAGAGLVATTLDPARRGGLLTRAGVLAKLAKADQTSPVHRGLFVREQLFCDTPPPPPPNANVKPPDLDPNLTTRERFSEHKNNPQCYGCHQLLDPIGLGFENFDGIGAWRDTEAGVAVDASGEIDGTDVAGPFNGLRELQDKLAGSAQVRACAVTQWFRYGMGRGEVAADACNLERARGRFAETGGKFPELIVALTQMDGFRLRVAPDLAGGAP